MTIVFLVWPFTDCLTVGRGSTSPGLHFFICKRDEWQLLWKIVKTLNKIIKKVPSNIHGTQGILNKCGFPQGGNAKLIKNLLDSQGVELRWLAGQTCFQRLTSAFVLCFAWFPLRPLIYPPEVLKQRQRMGGADSRIWLNQLHLSRGPRTKPWASCQLLIRDKRSACHA